MKIIYSLVIIIMIISSCSTFKKSNFSERKNIEEVCIKGLKEYIYGASDPEAKHIFDTILERLYPGFPSVVKGSWVLRPFGKVSKEYPVFFSVLGSADSHIPIVRDKFAKHLFSGLSIYEKKTKVSMLLVYTDTVSLADFLTIYHEMSHCYDYLKGMLVDDSISSIDHEIRAYKRESRLLLRQMDSSYLSLLSKSVANKLTADTCNEWEDPPEYLQSCVSHYDNKLKTILLVTYFMSYIDMKYTPEVRQQKQREFIIARKIY